MENTVNERIKILLNLKAGGNKSRLAKAADVSSTTIADLIEGRKGNPSFGVIEHLLKSYPDISPSWLMLGEGEMLKGQQPEGAGLTSGEATVEHAQELASNSALRELVESQRQQIATLTNMLDWARNLIDSLGLGKLLGSSDAAYDGQYSDVLAA